MNHPVVGAKVIVVGGGDTAIDAARVSKRLGAEVTLLYRRTRAEMPAVKSEIEGALEEGIKIEFLAAPVEILQRTDAQSGCAASAWSLAKPDSSGRPRPVPQPGSEFEVEASSVIAAISQEPEFHGLEVLHSGKDWIKTDDWGATPTEGVFAGGDGVESGLGHDCDCPGPFRGRSYRARFRGEQARQTRFPPVIPRDKLKLDWYKPAERHERSQVPVAERAADTEIELGLSEADVVDEAKRCMSCGHVHGLRNLLDVLH